jgi:hypothetical protein
VSIPITEKENELKPEQKREAATSISAAVIIFFPFSKVLTG